MKKSICILLIMLASATTFSQEVKDYKIKTTQNASERKEILDLLRYEILKEIDQEVIFSVNHLKLSGNYAWFEGNTLRKDGKEIVFPDNLYDCCHVEGLFEKVKAHG